LGWELEPNRIDTFRPVSKHARGIWFFLCILQSLRALGVGESECTILDNTTTSWDEYDTTWSSHEILVQLPRPWSLSSHAQFSTGFHEIVLQMLLINRRAALVSTGVLYKIFEYAAPREYLPVQRLHQRCILGNINHIPNNEPEFPPTQTQQDVLTTARDLIGMGRVNTWTDAGDGQPPCRARQEQQVNVAQDDFCPMYMSTLQPLYFDYAPRTVEG